MDDQANEYSKKYLIKALRDAGLPSTRTTLLKYEKKGVISKPASQKKFGDHVWNFYTKEEIDENVEKVRQHQKSLGNYVKSNEE